MELGFLNTSNKPIFEDQKYDSTLYKEIDSGEIGYVENKVKTYSEMDISDNRNPKDD